MIRPDETPTNRGPEGERGDIGETGETGARGLRGSSGFTIEVVILAGLDRVESKVDRLNVRMDKLVETTNHRMDEFTEGLDNKADKTGFGAVIAQHLARSKIVWIAFATFVTISAPVIVDHWRLLIERFPSP